MEVSPGNSEIVSSKATTEEEKLKIQREESSQNLQIKDNSLNKNEISLIKQDEEINLVNK